MCILDFFNMKILLQLLLTQKLISSKCVLFQNNLLSSDTVPLNLALSVLCLYMIYTLYTCIYGVIVIYICAKGQPNCEPHSFTCIRIYKFHFMHGEWGSQLDCPRAYIFVGQCLTRVNYFYFMHVFLTTPA